MADYSYAATGSGLIAPHHFPSMLYTFARDGTWERFESSVHDFRCSWNAESTDRYDDDTGPTLVKSHRGNWNRDDYPSVTSPTFSGSAAHPDWFVDFFEKIYPGEDVAPFDPYLEFYYVQKKKNTKDTGGDDFRALQYPPLREALWGTPPGNVSAFYCGIGWCQDDIDHRPWSHYGSNPGENYLVANNDSNCAGCGTFINPNDNACYTGDPSRRWRLVEVTEEGYNMTDIAHHETGQRFATAAMGHPIGAMMMWYMTKVVLYSHGDIHRCLKSGGGVWGQNRSFALSLLCLVRAYMLGFQWMDPAMRLDHFHGEDIRGAIEECVLHLVGEHFGGVGHSTADRWAPFGCLGSRVTDGAGLMPDITKNCPPWISSSYNQKFVDSLGNNWGKQCNRTQSLWNHIGVMGFTTAYLLIADHYVRELGVIDDGTLYPERAGKNWAIISEVTRKKLENWKEAWFEWAIESACWDRRTNSADDFGEPLNYGHNMDTGMWCFETWSGSRGDDADITVLPAQPLPSRAIADELIDTLCDDVSSTWYKYGEAPYWVKEEIYPKKVTKNVPTDGADTTGWIFKPAPYELTVAGHWGNSQQVGLTAGLAISCRNFTGEFYDKTCRFYTYLEYLLQGDVSGVSKPDYGSVFTPEKQHGMDVIERCISDAGGGEVEDPDDPGGDIEVYSFRGYMDLTATLSAVLSEKNLSGAMKMVGSLTVDEGDTMPVGTVRAVTFIGGMSITATMGRTADITAPYFTGAVGFTCGEWLYRYDPDDGINNGFVNSEFFRTFTGSVDITATNLGVSVEDREDRSSEDKDMLEYMTLEHMRNQVARHIGDTSSARAQKIDEWVNTAYSDVARAHRWPNLMRGRETGVTTTAGQQYLYLPKDVQQLYFIFTSGHVDVAPHQVIENMYRRSPTTINTSGLVESWADAGEVGVRVGFSSTAEQIQIDPPSSAAASDTFNVLVHGIVDDDEVSETLTVIGTTSGVTTNTYDDLYSVSTDGDHTGTVTVKGAISGTTYLTIGQYDRTARYRRIRLHHVPSSAETVVIYYKKRPLRLVYDDQVPEIPVSQYLIERAVASHYSQQRKWGAAMQMHEARAQKILDDLVGEEEMQGERVVQAMPVGNKGGSMGMRGGRTIVVNNG